MNYYLLNLNLYSNIQLIYLNFYLIIQIIQNMRNIKKSNGNEWILRIMDEFNWIY